MFFYSSRSRFLSTRVEAFFFFLFFSHSFARLESRGFRQQALTRHRLVYTEMQRSVFLILLFLSVFALSWPYSESLADYNLNDNKDADGPIDYWGVWPDHKYHPSPDNWRLPTYTIFLDRISNGDPTNDDINGTTFEHVLNSNQMRHGGDLEGLIDTLDYIQGMGFKVS